MQMNGRMDEFGTELNNARRKLAATEKQLGKCDDAVDVRGYSRIGYRGT
jgi:hypothetical protein